MSSARSDWTPEQEERIAKRAAELERQLEPLSARNTGIDADEFEAARRDPKVRALLERASEERVLMELGPLPSEPGTVFTVCVNCGVVIGVNGERNDMRPTTVCPHLRGVAAEVRPVTPSTRRKTNA